MLQSDFYTKKDASANNVTIKQYQSIKYKIIAVFLSNILLLFAKISYFCSLKCTKFQTL